MLRASRPRILNLSVPDATPFRGLSVSLIWEQLKASEDFVRSAPADLARRDSEFPRVQFFPITERRRSSRTDVYVPLFVYGYTFDLEPFHEDTNSLEVCSDGGLLRLEARVCRGQKLLLQNKVSRQELECTVVRVSKHLKRTFVGVAFVQSDVGFWLCRKQPA